MFFGNMRVTFLLACLTASTALPAAKSCNGMAGEDQSAACSMGDAGRLGSAMIQTVAIGQGRNGSAAPLQGRVATLTSEVASLEDRVSALESEVGMASSASLLQATQRAAGTAQKEQPPKAHDDSATLYAKYKQLLHKKFSDADLKTAIAEVETSCAGLQSRILLLENQVSGDGASSVNAFLELGSKGVSLQSRVEDAEALVEELRSRVTSLEQTVSGLQTSKVA